MIGEVKFSLEKLDDETREICEKKSELENEKLKVVDAIKELENDPELQRLLKDENLELIECGLDKIENDISKHREQLHKIEEQLEKETNENNKSLIFILELAEDGEDVEDEKAIIEARKKSLNECLAKIIELYERLDEKFDAYNIKSFYETTLTEVNAKEYLENLNEEFYDEAKDIAQFSDLQFYKAHLEEHIKLVVSHSIETAYVIGKIKGVQCDMKDIAIASLYHDTGMNGHYRDENEAERRYSFDDGKSIRRNHPLTSAIHVLEDREKIEALGGNADQIAAMVFLHSKSNSGVKTFYADGLKNINEAFAKIQDEVNSYNEKHKNKIEFNPQNIIDITKFKFNSAALRIGDACGHNAISNLTQSGGKCIVNYDVPKYLPEKWFPEKYLEEARLSDVTYISPNEEKVQITDEITKMFQSGEGNIAGMHVEVNSYDELTEADELKFVVDVKNASDAPLCTMQCIIERLKELKGTNRLFNYVVVINLNGRSDEKVEDLYRSFSRENYFAYGDIQIMRDGKLC